MTGGARRTFLLEFLEFLEILEILGLLGFLGFLGFLSPFSSLSTATAPSSNVSRPGAGAIRDSGTFFGCVRERLVRFRVLLPLLGLAVGLSADECCQQNPSGSPLNLGRIHPSLAHASRTACMCIFQYCRGQSGFLRRFKSRIRDIGHFDDDGVGRRSAGSGAVRRAHPSRRRVEDAEDGNSSTGEGFNMAAVTLEVGAKRGMTNAAPIQRN